MPTLRPLTEVARYDGRFFVDVVVPALHAAGFEGPVALRLKDPPLIFGDVDNAAVVLEATAASLDALLAGRDVARGRGGRSALDKLKGAPRATDAHAVSVSGYASSLRALLRVLQPAKAKARGASREVGAEASAPAMRKKRDRVRTADGHYIKGVRDAVKGEGAAKHESAATAPAAFLAAAGAAPTDRLGFALQNLGAFLEAGLGRAGDDIGDDELLCVRPDEVQRG